MITTIGGKDGPERDDPEYDATESVPATGVFLLNIRDLAVADAETVYLSASNSIQAIGPDGLITKLTTSGTGAAAVAMDGSDNLYFSHDDQVSVLPKISEDPVPVAADEEEAGTQWWIVIIGILVGVGIVAGYVLLRRQRSSRALPA